MDADLNNPIFQDTEKARIFLERNRWPGGAVCPHCGVTGSAITRVEGKKHSHRPGLYHCNGCSKQFTVTVGTVYEASHIPLHKWLLATHLMTSSKKGISAHQLHRMLGITYKSAWFMAHRIREGMRDSNPQPLGGAGKVIEADETYMVSKSKRADGSKKPGGKRKAKVVTLVERGGGARSFKVEHANAKTVAKILTENAQRGSGLMTDESGIYTPIGSPLAGHFTSHGTVMHSAGEYVRGTAHTNTIEGFFSIFKRGMTGVYQHCSEHHLQRYLNEFDFRYSNRAALGVTDAMRAEKALKGIEGKRLTYRRIDRQEDQDA